MQSARSKIFSVSAVRSSGVRFRFRLTSRAVAFANDSGVENMGSRLVPSSSRRRVATS